MDFPRHLSASRTNRSTYTPLPLSTPALVSSPVYSPRYILFIYLFSLLVPLFSTQYDSFLSSHLHLIACPHPTHDKAGQRIHKNIVSPRPFAALFLILPSLTPFSSTPQAHNTLVMDYTPSLARSSASPSNSYCPSDDSSLEYPSPDLIAQQYRISSLYDPDSFCSMAPTQDSDIPLFALDAVSQTGWSHTATTHAPSPSTALPTILPLEYDPFGGFGSTMPGVFTSGVYTSTTVPQTLKQTPLAASSSPGAPHPRSPENSVPRSPFTFSIPHNVLPSSSSATQAGIVAVAPSFATITSAPSFSPQRQVPYQLKSMSVYSTGGSAGRPDRYLPNGTSTGWGHPASTPEQFYAATSTNRQQAPGTMDNHQTRPPRPRKQPRRLTTKEEANFQCEVKGCGKLFSRSYNYKAHMETHDEKREYPFPCQVPGCPKRFVRKTDLQRHHQSVHMKERNHKCDYCGRLFARKDTLRRYGPTRRCSCCAQTPHANTQAGTWTTAAQSGLTLEPSTCALRPLQTQLLVRKTICGALARS